MVAGAEVIHGDQCADEGRAPAPRASDLALLRRLSLALTGAVAASLLAALFKGMSDQFTMAPTPTALMAKVEEQLRQGVPARSIRLGEEGSRLLPGSEPVFFAIPALDRTTDSRAHFNLALAYTAQGDQIAARANADAAAAGGSREAKSLADDLKAGRRPSSASNPDNARSRPTDGRPF